MSKKILFISLLVVLLTSAISINRAHAKTDPCSSWESWAKALEKSGFVPKNGSSLDINTKEVLGIVTRFIHSNTVQGFGRSLGLGDNHTLKTIKQPLRNLGGKVIVNRDDSLYVVFDKDNFNPCNPPGAPAGEETEPNTNLSGNPNVLNIVLISVGILATLLGTLRLRGRGKQAAYGGD